jgi:hypothetical protein
MTEGKYPGYLFAVLLLWCALTALPAAGGPDRVWGLIAWRADIAVWLPSWLIVSILSLIGLSGKSVWLERELSSATHRLEVFLAGVSQHGRRFLPLLALAPVGWILRSRNYFMGDGWALIENVRKPFYLHTNEPLDFFAHQLFSRLLAILSIKDGALAYQFPAVLILIPLFLSLLWKVSALVRPEKHERTAVFLILTFTGCLQIFLGHVESYGLVNLFLCLFLYLGLKAISGEGKSSLWLMTVVSVLAIFSHLSAITILPALAFALLHQRRFTNSGRSFTIVFSLCAVAAMAGILFFDLPGMTPLSASKTGDQMPYTLLDPRYLWFKLNLLLMLAPAAFMLFPAAMAGRWRLNAAARPELYFLSLSAAGPLFFFFGANAMLGLRDWDLLCLPALPLTLLVVTAFARMRCAAAGRALYLGIAALAASIQTLAFVWVNSGQESGVKFLDSMLPHEVYNGYNPLQLGYLFEEKGYLQESLHQYNGISQKEFIINRVVNEGTIYLRLGQPDSTIRITRDFLSGYGINSSVLSPMYSNLSLAYDLIGQPDSAHVNFMRCLEHGGTPNDFYIEMWAGCLRERVAREGYLRRGLENLSDFDILQLLVRLYALSNDANNMRRVYDRIWQCRFDCGQWMKVVEFSRKAVNAEFADKVARRAAQECPELAP